MEKEKELMKKDKELMEKDKLLMEQKKIIEKLLGRTEVPCGSTSRAGKGGAVHSDAENHDSTLVGGAERAVMLEHILMEGATLVPYVQNSHYNEKPHFWKVPAFSPLEVLSMDVNWQCKALQRCISIMEHCKQAVDCGLFHNDIRFQNVVAVRGSAKVIDWDFAVDVVDTTWVQFAQCKTFGVKRVQLLVESSWGSLDDREINSQFKQWSPRNVRLAV
eukprot:GHVR01088125.1.p1 GENE.GHVR01088125.1~~GHVR01088125.1.p1  ORF type:complete len:218 (-),score=31.69 GHVR01088125.1:137-790(-)